MKWIDTLERKFGRYAIHGLIPVIVAFNALTFILCKLNPAYRHVLALDPDRILNGEVWRLVTYIFVPSFGSYFGNEVLGVLLYLWFIWFVGTGLEEAIGAFKLNLYYLIGMIGITIAAFFFGSTFSAGILNTSLFFAFARYYPDEIIYVFFVLPAKIKWLAWVYGALLIFGFVVGTMPYRMALIAALSNYLIFFGPEIWKDAGHRAEVAQRRKKFAKATAVEDEALHRCVVCNRTEITNPELEFRVSADGNDYCVEHLPGKNPDSKGL